MDVTLTLLAILGAAVVGFLVGCVVRARRLREAKAELDNTRSDLSSANALADVRGQALEQRDADNERMATLFKGLTADALQDNRKQLLEAAKGLFDEKHELSKSELNSLMKPVGTQLNNLETQVKELDKQREVLSSQVGDLTDVTGGLRDVLRSSQGRGEWAEQHLRNVMELAGMKEHCDFGMQTTIDTDDGQQRPDAVVHLPQGAKIVIDAKAPLDSYSEACATEDAGSQRHYMERHAESLMGHVKKLGGKSYFGAVRGSVDLTVMYLPTDPMLDAAIKVKPKLWDEAFEKHRVLIVSPGVLLVLLRTAALAWQQQDVQDNAKKIADLGGDLLKSVRTYATHVGKLGRGLQQAVGAYNESVGTLEGTLLSRAQTLAELGAISNRNEIERPRLVETNVRELTKLELASRTDESDALSA